jgi:hypothetical protein
MVQLDPSTLMTLAVAGLMAFFMNNLRENFKRMEHGLDRLQKDTADRLAAFENTKIRSLETQVISTAGSLNVLSGEIIKQLSDLRVQFMATHPTKQEMEASTAQLTRRLDQIEGDIRHIAQSLQLPRQGRNRDNGRHGG